MRTPLCTAPRALRCSTDCCNATVQHAGALLIHNHSLLEGKLCITGELTLLNDGMNEVSVSVDHHGHVITLLI